MSELISEDAKLSIEVSKGGENRHIFWCDYLQQRRLYGTCLCLMDAHSAGRITPRAEDAYADCASGISRECLAVVMRKEEVKAGRAIYFTPRNEKPKHIINVDSSNESYRRGQSKVEALFDKSKDRQAVVARTADRVAQPIPQAKPKDEISIVGGNIADLITSEVKRAGEKSAVVDQLLLLKKEIAALAKTDPQKARQKLEELKGLKARAGVE